MIELIAFIDCETTGLLVKDAPVTAQPRITELACKMTTRDRKIVSMFSRIIRPDGWVIPPEVEKLTGITNDLAHSTGVSIHLALIELIVTIRNATTIVGHGLQTFDRAMIRFELERAENEEDLLTWDKAGRKMIDTMELATPLLKLPGQFGSYKWPSLKETMDYFERENEEQRGGLAVLLTPWEPRHRAGYDIEATENVYWSLRGISRAA